MAEDWLLQHGVLAFLSSTLQGVLVRLWTDGYTRGLGSSPAVVAVPAAVGQLGAAWLNQIARTTVKIIAGALIAGLALGKVLADKSRAQTIAVTEFQRAKMQAQMDVLAADGVTQIRWVTSHDANVCQHCRANEDAGPWQLGVPFPSGAMCPPEHPNCRCHIEKA